MNFSIKIYFLFIALTLPFLGNAQQQLTLRNAIDTALRNNFDIQIAKNEVEIARMNNTYGIAGGLPNITANAGDNGSISTINQNYRDSTSSKVSDKGQNALAAGVSGSIVLFNGFRVSATNYLKIIQNSLDVSNQKLDIVNVKKNVGMADAVETLQAQTDVNSAEQSLSIQKLVIEQNKSDLLLLISSKSNKPFSVTDTIIVDNSLKLDSITNYLNRNPEYLSAEQRILISRQIVKEVSAQRYPTVRLNAGYDFYQANINKGAVSMNQNYGPSAGINMQIPIFNGNIYKTQRDVAKISVENSVLQKESLQNSLATQATKLYRSYSTTLQQIESQRKNFEMTKQLVDVVMQQFHVSQATILDVKFAQTSFENAGYLLVNLMFSAKVAEIELKQLTYSLGY